MDAAAEQSRRTDSATLRESREGHQEAARIIRDLVGALREKQEQRMRLLWAACGGLFTGCLLWSFLPGVVARALPEGWHMPERMARHMVGEPTLWEAGTRIMRADSPEAWLAIADAAEMRRDNRDAIDACEQAAILAKHSVRCAIAVRSGGNDQRQVWVRQHRALLTGLPVIAFAQIRLYSNFMSFGPSEKYNFLASTLPGETAER